MDEVHTVFKLRWELPGTFKGLGAFKTITFVDNFAFEAMMTAKEISKNIRDMSENSALGPHHLSLRDLMKTHPQHVQLMELFNLWLVPGVMLDMMR